MPAPPTSSELLRLPADEELRRRVKRELRKRAQGLRKATPESACGERSRRIVQQLEELDAVKRATSVALFWPIETQHEVDLRAFDLALRARGARVAYPRIVRGDTPEERTGHMTFHFARTSELKEQGFGFAEPPEETPALSLGLHELDVVVVPALALDPAGQRIGYGAGYYDRALMAVPVLKVGVIFDFQLVSEVPALEGDVAVDWVVTDQRVLRAVRAEELCAPSTGGVGTGTPCST
jgi:5-formyltetrahydrofolate cyclo-ligase